MIRTIAEKLDFPHKAIEQFSADYKGLVERPALFSKFEKAMDRFLNEKGNGFTFYEFNGGELEYAIRRALNLYGDRKKWNTMVKHIMDEDFTWERSAKEYSKLYGELK